MRLSKLFVLAACIALAGALQAQVGVYALATGQHMTGINYSGTTPASGSVAGTGSFSPLGFTTGAYYDFFSLGRFRLGADLRASITESQKGALPGSNLAGGHILSALGGVRGTTPTHIGPVRLDPYVQASFGLVRSDYGIYTPIYPGPTTPNVQETGRVSNFGVTGILGVDVRLAPFMSLRIEGGSGAVFAGSRSSSLSGQTYSVASGSLPLQTFSMGLVFHSRRQ